MYGAPLSARQHGESLHNVVGKIGGDADLSDKGWEYAHVLADFVRMQRIRDLKVWTSWMKRTIQTAKFVEAPQERWKALNEIDAVPGHEFCSIRVMTVSFFSSSHRARAKR